MTSHPYEKAMSYLALFKESKSELMKHKNKHEDQEVFIFGTGPSIKNFDFSLAENKTVIYLNNAISLREKINASVEYTVITDFIRIRELRNTLISQNITTFCSSDKIFNPTISESFFKKPFIFIMPKITYEFKGRAVNCSPANDFMISKNINEGIYLGKSVVFPAMQIAWFMGHRKINLVGIDMTSNKGEYYDKSIKGHWAGFSYEKDAKEHFSEIVQKLYANNVEIFDHSDNGLNDKVIKFKHIEKSK